MILICPNSPQAFLGPSLLAAPSPPSPCPIGYGRVDQAWRHRAGCLSSANLTTHPGSVARPLSKLPGIPSPRRGIENWWFSTSEGQMEWNENESPGSWSHWGALLVEATLFSAWESEDGQDGVRSGLPRSYECLRQITSAQEWLSLQAAEFKSYKTGRQRAVE